MGAASGKKKGNKQKNKKGNNQETPENQSRPTVAPHDQEDQDQPQEQVGRELPLSQTEHAIESSLEPPESMPSTAETQVAGVRPASPTVAAAKPVDDVQNDLETSIQDKEELAALELPSGAVEADKEKNDLREPGHQTEDPQTPVAVAQTPLVSPFPAAIPLPSPSLSEVRYISSPTRSCTGSPAIHSHGSPSKATSPVSNPASPAAKFHSPAQPPSPSKIYSPMPKAASPAPNPISPIPKVSSPLVHPYTRPTMSQNGTPPMAPAVPSAHPSTAPGATPAHQSPAMSSIGAVPPYIPYRHPSVSNMHPIPHGYVDPAYASSFQAIHDLSMNGGYGLAKGAISPPENDHELVDLLQRIQSAIPDINRLMHGFKHTQGKLSSREAEFKQAQDYHAHTLMHKEYYIDALQSQMRKTAKESADESTGLKNTVSALRLELGNLQEKLKDLEENLAASGKTNEELSQSKADLEEQINKLNTSIQEARESHEKELDMLKEEHAEALASQKQELNGFFEEIKNEDEKAAAKALEAREKELLGQQESLKGEHEKEKQQMQESHDELQSEFDSKQTELASIKEELETKISELEAQQTELNSIREEVASKISELEGKQKELDEAHGAHENTLSEIRQGHADEMQSLKTDHEEELSASAKVLADKLTALKSYDEKEKQWAEEKSELENQLSNSERDRDKMEGDSIVKEQQLQQAAEEMRTTISGLGKESDRLRKTLNSLGEATDLKNTKGDSFFMESIEQLSRLIIALSKDHFAYIPIDPPKDILSKIPEGLPPFLDNTAAARELRSAYVQHVVSKTLTYRIFQPFLFTLGRRYDKADTFFQMLSMDIRRKSVRREAFWRQQTLKAAYTASDAKQSINVVAAVIVDEIINELKHFADPKQLDALLTAVRKIVKLAAETWRLARVERELILASLPPPEEGCESNDEWMEYGGSDEVAPSSSSTRHVILRTFPQIIREAAHEDFADDVQKASRCVYAHGTVLYSDSGVVGARLEELAKKEEVHGSGDEGSPRMGMGMNGGVEKEDSVDEQEGKL